MAAKKILLFVIDDDKSMLEIIESFISTKFPEIRCMTFTDGESALDNLSEDPQMVILDYFLNEQDEKAENGFRILRRLKSVNPALPVVMLSGQHNPEIAADIIKAGAFDYIEKNGNSFEKLEIVLQNLLNHVIINRTTINKRVLIMMLILFGFLTIVYSIIYIFG